MSTLPGEGGSGVGALQGKRGSLSELGKKDGTEITDGKGGECWKGKGDISLRQFATPGEAKHGKGWGAWCNSNYYTSVSDCGFVALGGEINRRNKKNL